MGETNDGAWRETKASVYFQGRGDSKHRVSGLPCSKYMVSGLSCSKNAGNNVGGKQMHRKPPGHAGLV